MNVTVAVGDVLERSGDVLICPANPWLTMSGGVNGEILRRCGSEIQSELNKYLSSQNKKLLTPGSIVVTSAASLGFHQIVHAVAIDAFYDTNRDLVSRVLKSALNTAESLGTNVVMPAIATGYGRLPFPDFGGALADAIASSQHLRLRLCLCLLSVEHEEVVSKEIHGFLGDATLP